MKSDNAKRQNQGNMDSLPLIQLYIYLNDGCTLACRHCWGLTPPAPDGRGRQILATEKIIAAIREGLPLGLQSVRLTGGEPFYHPDFDHLLDRLESLELKVTIETSGAGLTVQRAARLARLPQCHVMVRLNGSNAATHESVGSTPVSRMPGSFETAACAVKMLAQAGLPPHISFPILRQNAGQIPDVIRLAEELGAEAVSFLIVHPELLPQAPIEAVTGHHNGQPHKNGSNGHAKASSDLCGCLAARPPDTLTVEELIALGRRIEREMAHTTPLHLLFDQPPAFRGLQPMARIEEQEYCSILNTLSLLSTGEYGLCGMSANHPELVFGQVGDSLERIWREYPLLQTLRAGMPNRLEGICGHCIMKNSCMGHCPAESYLRTGSFWNPYWFCEFAEHAGLFPIGRMIENHW